MLKMTDADGQSKGWQNKNNRYETSTESELLYRKDILQRKLKTRRGDRAWKSQVKLNKETLRQPMQELTCAIQTKCSQIT